jgi:hypothetical protein
MDFTDRDESIPSNPSDPWSVRFVSGQVVSEHGDRERNRKPQMGLPES